MTKATASQQQASEIVQKNCTVVQALRSPPLFEIAVHFLLKLLGELHGLSRFLRILAHLQQNVSSSETNGMNKIVSPVESKE